MEKQRNSLIFFWQIFVSTLFRKKNIGVKKLEVHSRMGPITYQVSVFYGLNVKNKPTPSYKS